MFVKINGIPVNPEMVTILTIERSRGAGRKYHVQLYTVSGYNVSISDEYETSQEAEEARNDIVAALGHEQFDPGDITAEKDAIINELTAKYDEMLDAVKKLEEIAPYVEQLEKDLAAKDTEIEELNRKLEAAGKKESKK